MTRSRRPIADFALPLRILFRRRPISRPRYVLIAVATSLTVGILSGLGYWFLAVQILGYPSPEWGAEGLGPLLPALIGSVIFAPVLETLALALLVGVLRALGAGELLQVGLSALPLGMMHVITGATVAASIGNAFMATTGFLVFATVYVGWRRDGFAPAFWMSTLVHAVHNAASLCLLIAVETLGLT